MEEARKPENLPRNRYRDILPCENLSLSTVLLFFILLMGPFLCSVLAMKKFQLCLNSLHAQTMIRDANFTKERMTISTLTTSR